MQTMEMVKKRLKILEDLQEELNKIRGIYNETLDEDTEFQEIQETSKKFREETKDKKMKVMENPSIKKLVEQMKNVRDDIKDNRDILAQELADYYKESGSMEFVDQEGNVKRIIFSVKLIDH